MLNFTRKTKTIEIEGQSVTLKELSEKELQNWHERFHDAKGRVIRKKLTENRAVLAIISLVDENGNTFLDETHLTEIMNDWPSSALKRIYDAAAELNGLNDEEDDEKK